MVLKIVSGPFDSLFCCSYSVSESTAFEAQQNLPQQAAESHAMELIPGEVKGTDRFYNDY